MIKKLIAFLKRLKYNDAIGFAEWIEWSKYERFPEHKQLWFDRKSTAKNPMPIKTTEDLYAEYDNFKKSKP